jgi:Homeodomain-like domain-containing protein
MYREVTMIELREVLRLWQEHLPKKRIAARLGLDPKTVRRYLRAAEAAGLPAQPSAVSDEQLRDMLLALQPTGGRPRGEGLEPLPRTAGGDPALANLWIVALQDS